MACKVLFLLGGPLEGLPPNPIAGSSQDHLALGPSPSYSLGLIHKVGA